MTSSSTNQKKNEAEQGKRGPRVLAILERRVVKEGLSKDVIFKQRPAGSEGVRGM